MTEKKVLSINDPSFAAEHFLPGSLSDEIRIDQLIVALLTTFCRDSVAAGVDPLRAGAWARGADYFLRDFVVDHGRNNLFTLPVGQVRHFAGNWYIIKTVEPNRAELSEILEGVEAFYCYLQENGKVASACYEEVASACQDLDYYEERINAFWAISEGGYQPWDEACPQQKVKS